MILIDTSAWIEFLRDTGSATCNRVESLLASKIAICDAVRMEVLAGARDERHLHNLRRLLARATVVPTAPMHYDEAAARPGSANVAAPSLSGDRRAAAETLLCAPAPHCRGF